MGKIGKIFTALGVLTPAEYSEKRTFMDEERDLFNGKVKNAVYDAVVANGRVDRSVRLENINKFESSFVYNNKLTAALGNSACLKPRTNSRTRDEIRQLGR